MRFFLFSSIIPIFFKKSPTLFAKKGGEIKKILKILLVMSDAFSGLREVRVSKFSVAVKV